MHLCLVAELELCMSSLQADFVAINHNRNLAFINTGLEAGDLDDFAASSRFNGFARPSNAVRGDR